MNVESRQHLDLFIQELRATIDWLEQQSVEHRGRAPLYRVWAKHLDQDLRSLVLLAEGADE